MSGASNFVLQACRLNLPSGSEPKRTDDQTRLPIIDVARGGAALMVCAFHSRTMLWVGIRSAWSQLDHTSGIQAALGVLFAPLAFGSTAVPLFFVISGYCIHRSFAVKLMAEPDHQPDWRAYFIRRAWRIYPVLIAVLLITFALDQYTLSKYPADRNLGSLSLGTLLVNLFALQGVAGSHFGSNVPLWSLSVELQLYGAYPVIFYSIRKQGIRFTVFMTLLVSLVCCGLGCFFGLDKIIWFGPFWFSWTIGCAVAELESSKNSVQFGTVKVVAWFIISAIGLGLWLSPFQMLRPILYSCVSCFWALILIRCMRARIPKSFLFPLTLMAKLGVISYSLYAVHEPVILFARSFFFLGAQSRNILFMLPVILGCIVVAAALFLLVERHSLRVPRWLSKLQPPA